ncbi:MAG: hypothetical protein SO445_09850 [Lachnospiraceae bacterium]|nr:hypothetical protein [Lachnospiraceae bacterium]MDD7377940.1 hypothetical protein [Lachnospiraceae bacterium]MDY4617990.1 hypothetical protein [Lachnospiraceae bacterium]
MGAFFIGMWIFYSIFGLWIYHKIFTVYYTNLSGGIMKELVMSVFFGVIMSALTLHFWKISIVILLILGFVFSMKAEEKNKKIAIIAVFIVISIFVGVLGNDVNHMNEENDVNSQTSTTTESDL